MTQTCLWRWNGYDWEVVSDCEFGQQCAPPQDDGSYVGEKVETPCEPTGSA